MVATRVITVLNNHSLREFNDLYSSHILSLNYNSEVWILKFVMLRIHGVAT